MNSTSQIHITLNGQPQSIPADGDVRALLRWLKIDPEVGGLAVAINAAVVPRSKWGQTIVAPGADVEVVRATAGG